MRQGNEVASLSHRQAGWAPEQTAEPAEGCPCRAHLCWAEGERAETVAAAWSLVLPRATRELISSITHVVLVFGVGFFGNGISSAFLLSLWEEGAHPRGLGELWECDLVVSRGTGGKKQHHIYVLSCFYAGVTESSAHPYATQDPRWMRTVRHNTRA